MSSQERALCCAGALQSFGGPAAERHYPPDLPLEPVHLDIELTLDLAGRRAVGSVTTTVEARCDHAAELCLHAVDLQEVSVRDPDGHALDFAYDGREIRVHWRRALARGERRKVQVRYEVIEPVSGLFFSQPSLEYPDRPWYATTDHETERARHWLPCVDLPSVRTTLDVHLRAEQRFTLLANGYLVGERTHRDGTRSAHWRLEQRCPSYLICLAVGEFVRCDEESVDGVPIAYFASARYTESELRRTFGRTPAMLAWMSRKLRAPYPFPKYYQLALPVCEGAMENISLVSWNDMVVLDETLATEWRAVVDSVNVHEMAHAYFGDAIVCRDFAHAWLKESWATYMEQCWLEDEFGQDEALYDFLRNAEQYFEEADRQYARPVVTREFASSRDMYDRHLYPGGACRLHTLRCELGDEVFWAAVGDYVARYSGRLVETEDFRRVMEEHSGRSLVRFFEQWFYTPGYPRLEVSFEYDAKKGIGRFDVEQKQPGGRPFSLRTKLGWTLEGEHHAEPVRIERTRSSFAVRMAGRPEQVRFDPACEVLARVEFNPGKDALRRQLIEAPDVPGRIHAARLLVAGGSAADVERVRKAYAREGFWGVRQQMALALARAGTEATLTAFVECLANEADPRVMESIFRAAAGCRDPRVRRALEQRLGKTVPYRALGALYEALGAQRDPTSVARLAHAAEAVEFSGFAQAGALAGLAATGAQEAESPLDRLARHGVLPPRVRPAAARALAQYGALQDGARRARVVQALIDLLRDPDPKVRRAAAEGFRALPAPEAVEPLRGLRAVSAHQDQVKIDRVIEAIGKARESAEGALRGELQELRDRHRELEARVARLEARLNGKSRQG